MIATWLFLCLPPANAWQPSAPLTPIPSPPAHSLAAKDKFPAGGGRGEPSTRAAFLPSPPAKQDSAPGHGCIGGGRGDGGEGGATSHDRLPVIRQAPDFTLIDHRGQPAKLSDYRGKTLFVSFIFTTCNGSCPATTHRLAKIHDALERQPDLRKQTHFLSITLDPARDTPEMLRGYMKLYDLDDKHWTFITGPAKEVQKVHAAWGMWARPAANGQLDHPSRVFLVDKKGAIREIYNLDFLRIPWVMEDLQEVTE